MTRREAYIALNMITALGPVRVRKLVAALGSPEAVWEAGEEELRRTPGIGPEVARGILAQRPEVDPTVEEQRAKKVGARLITCEDPDYPEPLKAIYDPPLVLYVCGTLEKTDRHAIAVVGTRHASHYGLSVTDRLSYQLAKTGFTVVSGLARGIDTAAHRAALKGGGRTLAVLGSAIDRVYPEENAGLADEIAEHGAVISEYTMGREPDRTTFPYRNRVVSGLSMGIVVIEAGVKSGAVITATGALEQGRSVFAVPGRVDQPGARGCHMLIKQGARLCEGIDDVLQEFEMLIPAARKKAEEAMPRRPDVPLTPDEQVVVKALWKGGLDVDSLARAANLNSSQLSALLLGLEMKRVIRMLPGRVVELREDARPGG
ncbi:MAG TPA: DNA-processing protein DprA [Kiritimatiellia bacterium]|nr:DNA-processing protein DprA [Kiritimatiellia bacterium]